MISTIRRGWPRLAGLALIAGLMAANPLWAQEKRVLCTTFPVYLFAREAAQNARGIKVELLIKASLGCPHDYNPSPADMERISTADILIVNGLGLEEFLESALKVAKPGLKTIVASDGLTPLTDGDEESKPHDELEADHHHQAGGHHHEGPNPHVFASPRLAAHMVGRIADELSAADPAQADLYQENARKAQARYQALADQFKALGREAAGAGVVTEHDTFSYLARDMNLKIVGHIQALAGAAPSAARLSSLVKNIRQLGPAAILMDPDGDLKLAETLALETKLPVVVFDPVAAGPENPPLDYYDQAMTKNLLVLTEVLKGKGGK